MWHAVAPQLAQNFTVVAADLPGLRWLSRRRRERQTTHHAPSALGEEDLVAAMAELGFERFAVCGHDRGARVRLRIAMDHPSRVSRVAVLDIVPTAEMYDRADRWFGFGYWHWFFLIQPHFPEILIGHDARVLRGSLMKMTTFDAQALEAYRRIFGAAPRHPGDV